MILTCPNCGSQFQIDPKLLGENGRRVRCSGCGERWLATQPAAAPAAPPPPPVAPAPVEPSPERPEAPVREASVPPKEEVLAEASGGPPISQRHDLGAPARERRSRVFGLLCLVLVLLLLTGLILLRNEVARAVPSAVAVFENLGFPVTVQSGLEIRNLTYRRVEENGIVSLVVQGEVANVATTMRSLPALRVGLQDAARTEIDFGLFDLPQRILEAGRTMEFEVRLVDPPSSARTFRVNFDSSP